MNNITCDVLVSPSPVKSERPCMMCTYTRNQKIQSIVYFPAEIKGGIWLYYGHDLNDTGRNLIKNPYLNPSSNCWKPFVGEIKLSIKNLNDKEIYPPEFPCARYAEDGNSKIYSVQWFFSPEESLCLYSIHPEKVLRLNQLYNIRCYSGKPFEGEIILKIS